MEGARGGGADGDEEGEERVHAAAAEEEGEQEPGDRDDEAVEDHHAGEAAGAVRQGGQRLAAPLVRNEPLARHRVREEILVEEAAALEDRLADADVTARVAVGVERRARPDQRRNQERQDEDAVGDGRDDERAARHRLWHPSRASAVARGMPLAGVRSRKVAVASQSRRCQMPSSASS